MTRHFRHAALLVLLLGGSCEQQRGEHQQLPSPSSGISKIEEEPRREVLRRALAPWPEAASVRLFVHVGDYNDPEKEFIEPAGRRLNKAQREAIEDALTVVGYNRLPDAASLCFVPHHFVRYYDGAGKQIGEIAICFCCEGVSATPDLVGALPNGVGDAQIEFDGELASAIESLGLPTNVRCE